MMSVLLRIAACGWTICASVVVAGVNYDVPHELRWIPYAIRDYFVTAAFDENDLPVVLYDPLELSEVPEQLAAFMLLREERIALLAREMIESGALSRRTLKRERGSRFENSSGRFALIAEENVYRHAALEGPALASLDTATRLSCLVYLQLNERERTAVIRQYEFYAETGRRLTFGGERGRSGREFRSMMQRCVDASKR